VRGQVALFPNLLFSPFWRNLEPELFLLGKEHLLSHRGFFTFCESIVRWRVLHPICNRYMDVCFTGPRLIVDRFDDRATRGDMI